MFLNYCDCNIVNGILFLRFDGKYKLLLLDLVWIVDPQVKITDMHLRESPRELMAGSPVCAPSVAVMAESMISLIRSLHMVPAWSNTISEHMCGQLQTLHAWTEDMTQQQQQPNTQHASEGEKVISSNKAMTSGMTPASPSPEDERSE